MTREELIKSISKRECHLAEIVHDLIKRAISENEKVEGKYRKAVTVKIEEAPTKEYDYYIVTESKFIKIFASDQKYWSKLCPLDKFVGAEETNLPKWGGISVEDVDVFINAGSPGEWQTKIYFDVSDEDLRQVTFATEEYAEIKEIREFLSCVTTAVHNRLRR